MTERNELSAADQPDPISNDKPACWDLVIKDMRDRDDWGRSKYNTPLQPFNGRNVIVDFYQELLDAVVYCRQLIEEWQSVEALMNQYQSLIDQHQKRSKLLNTLSEMLPYADGADEQ
jgi:hypothetical protein